MSFALRVADPKVVAHSGESWGVLEVGIIKKGKWNDPPGLPCFQGGGITLPQHGLPGVEELKDDWRSQLHSLLE